MKNKLLILVILSFVAGAAFAKVTLPDILSDNMVLQQSTNVKLWGKASPNSVVKVQPSWVKMTKTDRKSVV